MGGWGGKGFGDGGCLGRRGGWEDGGGKGFGDGGCLGRRGCLINNIGCVA